jgi:hypothetical protein
MHRSRPVVHAAAAAVALALIATAVLSGCSVKSATTGAAGANGDTITTPQGITVPNPAAPGNAARSAAGAANNAIGQQQQDVNAVGK